MYHKSYFRLVFFCTSCLLLFSYDFFQPEYEPKNKILVSGSVEDGSLNQLFVYNPDGTGRVRISNKAFEQPTWSPDGNRIAGGVYIDLDDVPQLVIVGYQGNDFRAMKDADTGQPIYISTINGLTWSPDSRSVLFWGPVKSKEGLLLYGLRIVDIASGKTSFVEIDLDGERHSAKWSPDGKRVLFTHRKLDDSNRTVSSSLYLVNLDGEVLGRVETDPGFHARNGLWSRSGDRIFYLQYSENPHAGSIMSIELSTGLTRVIQNGHRESGRRWRHILASSPDDQVLLVMDDDSFLYQIDLETNVASKMPLPEFERYSSGGIVTRIHWADWSP